VKSYYWSKLHCDERDAITAEHSIIMALLVGVLWAVTAVSSMRIGHAACASVALPVRASIATERANPESAFAEQHWRIGRLAERWAVGRETVRLLFKDDPAVIRISHGRKKAHTTYIIPPAVAQRIHAQLSGSNCPFDELHFRIRDLAGLWGLSREKVRLVVKDEPGVMRFKLGRKKAHTTYSVPESVAARIYACLPYDA
jgi:hypothetical protein